MANLPATGDITALASNAAAQVAFEALRDWLSQLPAGPEVQLTISAGTITPATRDQGSIKVETEAAAATDDLANIAQTNIQNGSELLLRAYDASHTVVVKHAAGGAGQILLQYDADFSLDDTDKWLRLKRVGTDWIETHRCWGNDPLAQRQALGFKATADIASAATVDLSTATGNVTRITGTTAVSAWTMNAGQWHMVIADGALPLTYHATTNKLNTGGSNYTCAAGDRVLLHKDNSGVIQATIIPVSGKSVVSDNGAKVVSFTRDLTLASGNQAVAGVGFKPSSIIFTGAINGSANEIHGLAELNGTAGGHYYGNGITSWYASPYPITFYPAAGSYQIAQMSSFDADGFTLSWTKTGAPTGTGTIYALCLR